MVSAFTENALYSVWKLIACKYVCAASQLFLFQQLVSTVGFSVYSTVDRRTGKRIALIVSFAKCLISVKKTRRTDGHRMTAYTGKNRHFYVPRPSFFVCHGEAPVAIMQNVAWMKRQFSACQTPHRLAACTHVSSTVSQLFEPQVPKIAVFTYRSPYFCFPWRCPCDYHAMCCIDGKTIQCLPNPSHHVPIYLQ